MDKWLDIVYCLWYNFIITCKGVIALFYKCEQSIYILESYLKYGGLLNELENHVKDCKSCQEIHAQVIEELKEAKILFND